MDGQEYQAAERLFLFFPTRITMSSHGIKQTAKSEIIAASCRDYVTTYSIANIRGTKKIAYIAIKDPLTGGTPWVEKLGQRWKL